MEVSTMLLIAQVSSAITSVIGLVAIYFTIRAANGLVPGQFKNLILFASTFLVLTLIGVISMTFYHIMNGAEIAEIFEKGWYVFIFVCLFASLFESYKVIEFGKIFSKISFNRKKNAK